MATAHPKSMSKARRGWQKMLLLPTLAAALLLVWFWKPLGSSAVVGAAYGARITCSCHYIAGRSLSDCRKDFEPRMSLIVLSVDKEAKSVSARFPLLASQTATFREGQGCVLERWDD